MLGFVWVYAGEYRGDRDVMVGYRASDALQTPTTVGRGQPVQEPLPSVLAKCERMHS